MKCLGAMDGFIMLLFVFESIIMGMGGSGIGIASMPKLPCETPREKVMKGSPQPSSDLVVEVKTADGSWLSLSDIPPREYTTQEILFTDAMNDIEGEILTLRLSWLSGYSTDAISQLIPSDEEPVIKTWRAADFELQFNNPTAKMVTDFDADEPLILKNGDMIELSFEVDDLVGFDTKREYIVRAVGRYQPDYSVMTHLTPGQFQLLDNYPNPFNPATVIGYDLPQACHVTVDIYNILGQHTIRLVDGEQEAGNHQVVWDAASGGNEVASGIYFYRLTAGDFTASKKMLLLK